MATRPKPSDLAGTLARVFARRAEPRAREALLACAALEERSVEILERWVEA